MHISKKCFTFVKSKQKTPIWGPKRLDDYMKDRIRQIMEVQHMTQQVFANYIGTTPATLSGIFNDRTRPTINIIESIKKKFPDISLEWLMFGIGDMHQKPAGEGDGQTASTSSLPDGETDTPEFFSADSLTGTVSRPSSGTGYAPQPAPNGYHGKTNRQDPIRDELKFIDRPIRHVTEIRVYYDDQTWESFVPSKK